MTAKSAGILLYRKSPKLQVFLAHMGGPFWESKDDGAWGIPKGLVEPGEELIDAAIRECAEEVGFSVNAIDLESLGFIKMKSGKEVHAWACEVASDCEIVVSSNTFELEWPKGSGEIRSFPEIDSAKWFDLQVARQKIISVQKIFLDGLEELLR
jgi:predicted NUDIX family NTP pyrophosphohydrolase